MTISGMTIVSRLAGFVRDTMLAALLGAGPIADAFFVAQRLPNLFRSLFAEGAFNSAFVPLYTAEKTKQGDDAAKTFSGDVFAMLLLILLPFCALIVVAMPWVMLLLAPGFQAVPDKFAMAVDYSRITFPYLLLISITSLQGGVLNARGHFGPSAFAPVLYNIVLIIVMVLAYQLHGDIGIWLSWSVTIAGAVQALWLFQQCKKYHLAIPLAWPRLTESVRRMFKQVGPGAVGAGAGQINLLISTMLTSTLPTGAISYLFYADRLYQLPLGVIGIAVATALLPILSTAIAENNQKAVTYNFSRALEFVLILGVTAAVGLILIAAPIIQTLFERGAFSPAATAATASALQAYALGVPAILLTRLISPMFFARHDTKTPVKVALISIVSNIIFALLLLPWLRHVGIALAVSLAAWINFFVLFYLMRRQFGLPLDALCRSRIPKILLGTIVMGVVTFALNYGLKDVFATRHQLYEILALAAILGGAMAAFFATGHWLKAWHWQDLLTMLKQSKAVKKPIPDSTD